MVDFFSVQSASFPCKMSKMRYFSAEQQASPVARAKRSKRGRF